MYLNLENMKKPYFEFIIILCNTMNVHSLLLIMYYVKMLCVCLCFATLHMHDYKLI